MKKANRSGRIVLYLFGAAVLALLLAKVDAPDWGAPPAAELLPELPAYRHVEGQTITVYIGALAKGGAILAGQPQLAATVAVVDTAIGCLQETGGVRARVYSHAERPFEAGGIVVVDVSRLDESGPLLECIASAALELEGPGRKDTKPCVAAYTLQKNGAEFQIVYAGSTHSTCRDFCLALEGCDPQFKS